MLARVAGVHTALDERVGVDVHDRDAGGDVTEVDLRVAELIGVLGDEIVLGIDLIVPRLRTEAQGVTHANPHTGVGA